MRTRIITAALAEMDEHGVRFTMSNLAARLGISKRTLYEHFDSKEVLVEAIVDAIITDLQVQRLEILNNPDLCVREKLIRMLKVRSQLSTDVNDRVKMELGVQYPGLLKKARKAKEEQWAILEGVLQDGIAAGYFRPIFVPVLHRLLQGAIHEIMDYNYLLENKTSFDEMIGHITDIVLYGIIARDTVAEEAANKGGLAECKAWNG